MTKLHLDLHDILIDQLLALLHPLEHVFDLEEFLAEHRLIAHVWGVADVLIVRPDLTEDQAWEVLETCDEAKDRSLGLTWDTIRDVAAERYGPCPPRS